MSKHTPGPWWFAGMEIGTVPNMGIKVARVSGANVEEAKANGRLMSKAPELLDHLEAMFELAEAGEVNLESDRGFGRNAEQLYAAKEMPQELVEARAFLARLKGEQP